MQSTPFVSSTGETRNPIYEGQFEGETVEQADARLHWAKVAMEMARNASLSAPSHGEQVREWNLSADGLPACGKPVLAYYLNSHGKGRRIRAEYVKAWTVQADDLSDPDTECVEYSEQEDAYYIRQGWYELIDNWDEYGRIAVHEGVITHWQELPAAPSAGSQGGDV